MRARTGSDVLFTWFSGFFGLAALAHLTRAAAGLELAVRGVQIPLAVSWSVGLVSLFLSLTCLKLARRGECCQTRESSGKPDHDGCCH